MSRQQALERLDPDSLERWLTATLTRRQSIRVESIAEVPGGWESDVYDVLVRHGDDSTAGSERLALRRYSGEGDVAVREFAGMRHLSGAGYPVPEVLGVEPSASVLGRPFMVMSWVDGEVRSWRSADLEGLAGLMSDLHLLDWRPLRPDAASGAPTLTETLDEWRAYLVAFPVASVAACLEWAQRATPSVEPAIVHLDFHTGNVLIDSDGSATVIDWTQVGVADRRFDLAWTEMLLSMALDREEADRFRTAYEHAAGEVDHMEWFEAVMAVKRLFSVLVSVQVGPEAMGMRPEARERMIRDLPTLASPWRTVKDITGIDVVEARRLFDA